MLSLKVLAKSCANRRCCCIGNIRDLNRLFGLVRGHLADNTPLPFGAEVKDGGGTRVGFIAQGGQAMVRVNQQAGNLRVIWGDGIGESCSFDYKLPEGNLVKGHLVKGDYRRLEVICK